MYKQLLATPLASTFKFYQTDSIKRFLIACYTFYRTAGAMCITQCIENIIESYVEEQFWLKPKTRCMNFEKSVKFVA